jgi:hypothetical protein
MSGNDYQKSKVYQWEHNEIKDRSKVAIADAQVIVNHVWKSEGLMYPPTVVPIHVNTTKASGKANRTTIYLQPVVSTSVILHEIAHSMTMTVDGDCMWHNGWWLGVYVKLLDKYLKMPLIVSLYTLKRDGIDVNINAYPVFLDA